MPQETPSPIDLPAPPLEQNGLGWATGVLAIASLLLLCANAQSLSDWIEDQPPSALQAQASELAGTWLDAMKTIGIARPRDALHTVWKRAEAARFHVERNRKDHAGRAGDTDQR